VCREIRSRWPRVVCVILTSFADDEALQGAVLAGAAGYLLKQLRGSELVDDVRKVAHGHSLIDAATLQRALGLLRGDHDRDGIATLTPQERRILDLIAEGMTNRQIGERLYLAEKTVKNYVSSILAKLGLERRTQAAVLASKLLRG
jgi:two-component system, NarL family, response regulator DevR